MKKSELVKLLKFLNSYYQQKFEYPKSDKADTKMLQETWFMFLGEYDYNIVRTATKKLVANKEWPPTPGELVKEIENLQKSAEDKLTAGEAWEQVVEAIGRYGYFHNPGKVKEAIPDKALRAAEVVGLDLIARQGGESFVMNSYMKVYRNLADKREKVETLPGAVREEVRQLEEKCTMQIEGSGSQ